jgi:hypothetical protein
MSKSSPAPGSFRALLHAHFQDDRPGKTTVRAQKVESFAADIGQSSTSVYRWLSGKSVPNEIERTIGVLYGQNHKKLSGAALVFYEAWKVVHGQKKKAGRKPKPRPSPIQLFDRSAIGQTLLPAYLDAIPISADLKVEGVEFGEGCRVETIAGEALAWLDPEVRLTDAGGRYDGSTRFVPGERLARERAEGAAGLLLPRLVRILGRRPDPRWEVQVYIITDTSYLNGAAVAGQTAFVLDGVIGKGGLAAFVNRWGSVIPRDAIEIGEGLGCAAVFSVVGFADGVAVGRSPYFVGVRAGIRYPDDVWASPATGAPILSRPELERARFLFQSWEADGGSRDVFAADFNGGRMTNLNRDDEPALDALVDEDGQAVAEFIGGRRVAMASNINGNGFLETVVRTDAWD